MLYDVGTHLGGVVCIPSDGTVVGTMRSSIPDIINSFKETLTVHRSSTVYGGGKGEITWSSVGQLCGDWQPQSGLTERQQASLGIESDANIVAEYGVNVKENDKIFREDGTFEYVVYVRRYATHTTIYLNSKKGQK